MGFSTFTLGSALCGFSPTIHFLIGSRIIQGVGAASLMASGPAILATAFPEEKRGQALGLISSVVSAGFLTGPILGGFMVEHLGWRSVFFLNLPVGLVGIFLSRKFLEKVGFSGKSPLDIPGALLIFVLITAFLLFLNRVSQGGSLFIWGWLLSGLICLGLLIWVESRSPSPLIDLDLFRQKLFIASLGTGLLIFWMGGAHNFVLPFFLQDVLKFPPSKVGMLIFPVPLTVMIMAPLTGRFSDRIGVRIPATIGLILLSLTTFSFHLLGTGASEEGILLRQVFQGLGIAFFMPANNSAILSSLPKERVGLASSFMAFSRNLGMAMGIAFAEMVIAFRTGVTSLEPGKGCPPLEGLQDVWKSLLVIGLAAVVLSWTRTKSPALPGKDNPSGGPHKVQK